MRNAINKAVPALLARLGQLDAVQAAKLRREICARPPGQDSGAAFNTARASAKSSLARACGAR